MRIPKSLNRRAKIVYKDEYEDTKGELKLSKVRESMKIFVYSKTSMRIPKG